MLKVVNMQNFTFNQCMLFRLFSLHPEIFESFLNTSLVARAVDKQILQVGLVNWREQFGQGNYRQVDDRPFGGGDGMVLQVEPIYQALQYYEAISKLYTQSAHLIEHRRIEPNNQLFYQSMQAQTQLNPNFKPTKATILLTPRGYTFNQECASWLSQFSELNILCGRYEGFDARLSEVVDLELSIGNFILNGGEVGAMAMLETISRLLPDFVTKTNSIAHDSFSPTVNHYPEQAQYSKNKPSKNTAQPVIAAAAIEANVDKDYGSSSSIFNRQKWLNEILPYIEHPQYTRPEVWNNFKIPEVLKSGNHNLTQFWRQFGWQKFDKNEGI